MIVVDASAVLEMLLGTRPGQGVAERLFARGQYASAPHLLDVEVAHVLRKYEASGELSPQRGAQSLRDLSDLNLQRFGHEALLPRVWALRKSLSAYDAVYVALAEALGCPLLTADARLARSHGHKATVELA